MSLSTVTTSIVSPSLSHLIPTTPTSHATPPLPIISVSLSSPTGAINTTIWTLGAMITSVIVKNCGEVTYNDRTSPQATAMADGYRGRSVGRLAGRVANYQLPGRKQKTNLQPNSTKDVDRHHLHGGLIGYSHRVWTLERTYVSQIDAGCVMSLVSPDGEEGHPGGLVIYATFVVSENPPRLEVRYEAELTAGEAAAINLTTHCYWNLAPNTGINVLQHELWMPRCKQVYVGWYDTAPVPVATITELDFCAGEKLVKQAIDKCFQVVADEEEENGECCIVARLRSSEVIMTVKSSPCRAMVVYTGTHLGFAGICFETLCGATNEFVVLTRDKPNYKLATFHEFDVVGG